MINLWNATDSRLMMTKGSHAGHSMIGVKREKVVQAKGRTQPL